MFVAEEMIEQMVDRHGRPQLVQFRFALPADQFERIRASQKNDRNHDITVYIRKDERFVVIAKHMYPPGLFRAPSGGLRPGETILEGIDRELAEETGCRVSLERFLLRTRVAFVLNDPDGVPDDVIDWRSFVFSAAYRDGDFQFTDHREIREVRLAGLDEFEEFSRIMRATNIAGLHYRAALHDTVKPLLQTAASC
jgi:8-oxo-dGTP pyrophosphatase MutT (NUDIX family)